MVGPGDERKLAAFPEGVPAGVPQSYVDVYIMALTEEKEGDPLTSLPTGQVGEIVFGGGGEGFLAVGYWQNAELTAEKFVETKSYGRLYRTGDAGFWQDGEVVVAGRLDRQVKVRGVRIQPEEIESKLKRYTDSTTGSMPVKGCMVVPSAQEPIELTAFIETKKIGGPDNGEFVPIDTKAVIAFLLQELGRVYVPKHIVHLERWHAHDGRIWDGLPRTDSGKPEINELKRLASQQEGFGFAPEQLDAGEDQPRQGAAGSTILGQVPSGTDETGGQWWSVDLRSPMFKFVQDHRYKREPLFPGAGYISLAMEACTCLWPGGGWELQRLEFKRPLLLQPPRELQVSATFPTGRLGSPKEAQLRISSRPLPELSQVAQSEDSNNWTLHCTCAAINPAPIVMIVPPTDESGIVEEYSVVDLYAQLADGGFDYGPQFQTLRSVSRRGGGGSSKATASGELSHRGSQFLLDPVDIDAAFQMAPLVSQLGFNGAPTGVKRVHRFAPIVQTATDDAELVLKVDVKMNNADDGSIDFLVSSGTVPLYVIEGLQLQTFDTEPPDIMQLVSAPYRSSGTERQLAAPRVIAVGQGAEAFAKSLATVLGNTEELCIWNIVGNEHNEPTTATLQPISHRSAALVVRSSEIDTAGVLCAEVQQQFNAVAQLLPSLGLELPARGRVWIVIVGEEATGSAKIPIANNGSACFWECAARGWAVKHPALLLSTLRVTGDPIGRAMRLASSSRWIKDALLDPVAPPSLQDGQSWRLQRHSGAVATAQVVRWFAGMELQPGAVVAVLSTTATALTHEILLQLRDPSHPGGGIEAVLVLPGEAAPCILDGVIFCAISQPAATVAPDHLSLFDIICARARQCVTLCSMAALLPTAHSASAGWSARAAEAAFRRQTNVSAAEDSATLSAWVIFSPPLFSGLRFEPPAPTGFHRCSVDTFVQTLADAPANCGTLLQLYGHNPLHLNYPCYLYIVSYKGSLARLTVLTIYWVAVCR